MLLSFYLLSEARLEIVMPSNEDTCVASESDEPESDYEDSDEGLLAIMSLVFGVRVCVCARC